MESAAKQDRGSQCVNRHNIVGVSHSPHLPPLSYVGYRIVTVDENLGQKIKDGRAHWLEAWDPAGYGYLLAKFLVYTPMIAIKGCCVHAFGEAQPTYKVYASCIKSAYYI